MQDNKASEDQEKYVFQEDKGTSWDKDSSLLRVSWDTWMNNSRQYL